MFPQYFEEPVCSIKLLDESNLIRKQNQYSKSLDELQYSCRHKFYSSLSSFSDLNNISCSHNNQNRRKRYQKNGTKQSYEVIKKSDISDKCDCYNYSLENGTLHEDSTYSSIGLNVAFNNMNNGVDKKYKQFVIKNLCNVKQKYQKLVKSLSHTPSESTQHIFRSNSVQIMSPNQISNFEQNHSAGENSERTFVDLLQHDQKPRKCYAPISPTSIETQNVENEELSSISSENSLFLKKDKSLKTAVLLNVINLRKVRSAACLGEDVSSIVLSGTESLPNISSHANENIHYIDITSYSSSSSTCTSERSGWVSSQSSSVTSLETNKSFVHNRRRSWLGGDKKLQNLVPDRHTNAKALKRYQKLDKIFVSDKGKKILVCHFLNIILFK